MQIKPQHPRLLVTESTWSDLRQRRQKSPTLDRLLKVLEHDGRALLEQPPLVRQLIGRRLLATSREALRRVMLWSFNFRLTGDKVFLQGAEKEMLNLAGFPDWHPPHFLDTAEMTAAMAYGYDWLHDALAPESRATIRQAIVDKGLKPGLDPQAQTNWWYHGHNNWNQVCLCGMLLGALAVAEDEPALAQQFIEHVRQYNPNGMKPYQPDGVYPEGPIYWGYGTSFQVMLLAALESALGSDLGLSQSPGFLATADYPREVTGPTGFVFNYSDGEEAGIMESALFWFARKVNRRDILNFQFDYLAKYIARKEADPKNTGGDRILPLMAIWSDDLENRSSVPSALSWFREGINPLAIFRTSWSECDALFVALKGGIANASHGHMDAGSFVLEADGVRWGLDLDKQDYESLEAKNIGLWDSRQDGDRWRVFRINNFSHNTLTINQQLHRVDGRAEIIRFSEHHEGPHAVVDLSPVFAGQAGKVVRGFKLLPRRQLLIQDELSGLKPNDVVRWALVTRAQVTANGSSATLRQDGKVLQALLNAPGAKFEVISGNPPDDGFNAPNPGVSILIANVPAPESGKLTFQTLLGPGEAPLPASVFGTTPCESWSAPLHT